MINNRIQAYYLVSKINEDLRIGKMENLISQYLRSVIDIFSHLQREIERVKSISATDSFGEGLAKNQKINELSEQLFELKDNEFIKKSKINRLTKQKIDEIYNKSALTNTKSDSFMIYFEVR